MISFVFPGANIEAAADIDAAKLLIQKSIESEDDFDAVIADVKVPVRVGENPGVYPAWLEAMHLLDPRRTQVIPTSAFLEEDEVKVISELAAATPVPKGPKSAENIIARIAGHIIRRDLDSAFGSRGAGQFSRQQEIPSNSATIPLARLTENIRLLWRRLAVKDRERVLEYFDVIERADGSGDLESVSLGGKA